MLEGLLGLHLIPDGKLPGFPRATCELQGYAYDAKVRGARLARTVWHDAPFADRLEKEAADLKRRFNRDFWIEDRQYFAVALDDDGRRVDSSPQITATFSGAGSSTSRRPRRSRTPDGYRCSPDGAYARSPTARRVTTRSAITSGPSGRLTTHSSPGVCAATASRRRQRPSWQASWRQQRSSPACCPRRSAGTSAAPPGTRCNTPTACSRKRGPTGATAAAARWPRPRAAG